MRVIKAMHLFFAEHLPEEKGVRISAQCGKELAFEGFVPRDMIDGRMCKECVGKINGFSVLSGSMGVKCFVILEFVEGSNEGNYNGLFYGN